MAMASRTLGDSVVLDFTGQPLVELHDEPRRWSPCRSTLEALRAWRDKFPAHLDADAFLSNENCSNHEEAHAGQPSAGCRAAARQPAGHRAYLPERQVRVRDHRRHAAHAARRDAGLFLHARQQSDHAPARADAGAAAGARRLPGDGVGRQCHRADADRADQGRAITSCVSSRPTARRATSSAACWRASASSTRCCRSRTWPGIENVLASRPTRLVMFESPTNPVTKVADIERLVELAHRHGALAVMDNTFAGFHQHGEYDVDVFVHSLTKYASGTGDVMGGAVIARHELIDGMRPDFSVLGALARSARGLPDPARTQDLLRALPRADARRPARRRAPGGASGRERACTTRGCPAIRRRRWRRSRCAKPARW